MSEDNGLNERIRKTTHLLLDMANLVDSEGSNEALEALLVGPFWEIPAIDVDPEEESVDPRALMVAVDFVVSALLNALVPRTGQEKIEIIAELREKAEQDLS